tara:strand:- start:1388 stop:1924 length:537 start_codon:yes stop_codon:yes gene_type:complete
MVKKKISTKCNFSDCGTYRWSLELEISYKNKEIIFIGLNPSLSNEYSLDNTTKKIIKICNKNNYGKIKLINLFGLISSSPKLLFLHHDPIGNLNNEIINFYLDYWAKSIHCNLWLGWGNKGRLFDRDLQIYKILGKYSLIKRINFPYYKKPLLIRKTKFNNPIHPLYCQDNSELREIY